MRTATVHSAVLFPSSVLTVMVAPPTLTPVTTPFSTVATASSLLVQMIFLFVASAGATVAVSVSLSPTFNAIEVLSNDTPVTRTALSTTVMVIKSVLLPALAVTTALPGERAIALPALDTISTSSFDELHTRVLSVASSGRTTAVSVALSPTVISKSSWSMMT